MSTNIEFCSESKDSLVKKILCDEFGTLTVYRSMKHINDYKSFHGYNPSLISKVVNELSIMWQMGKARDYLESQEEWLQHCLICHLFEDYFVDTSLVGN